MTDQEALRADTEDLDPEIMKLVQENFESLLLTGTDTKEIHE